MARLGALFRGARVVDPRAPARRLAEATLDWLGDQPDADAAFAPDGKALIAPLAEIRLHAPVRRPGKAIAVGRNYVEYLAEMGNVPPHAVPASWIKATSAIIGPVRDIVKPAMVRPLDYETELAVPIRARVNGEIRQDGSTARIVFAIPELIAYLSRMTLEPGDVILTGTPAGVAMGRKPDPEPYFLRVGDVLESEIEGIGAMRHSIVAELDKEHSWDWGPAMGEDA